MILNKNRKLKEKFIQKKSEKRLAKLAIISYNQIMLVDRYIFVLSVSISWEWNQQLLVTVYYIGSKCSNRYICFFGITCHDTRKQKNRYTQIKKKEGFL